MISDQRNWDHVHDISHSRRWVAGVLCEILVYTTTYHGITFTISPLTRGSDPNLYTKRDRI